jgi:hypothetical protein
LVIDFECIPCLNQRNANVLLCLLEATFQLPPSVDKGHKCIHIYIYK